MHHRSREETALVSKHAAFAVANRLDSLQAESRHPSGMTLPLFLQATFTALGN
jgi:hypothetical protein